jgi:hypothetical protein
MIISVINHTNGKLSDAEVQKALRAINRQISEDFSPYWGLSGALRLEGKAGESPDKQALADMRGDAVLYLWDKTDVDGALGYHDRNNRGIPFGFVFTDLVKKLGESWTVTLSHEALELVADPEVNLLVMGPHPADPQKTVFHWYEMCDAVQAETYKIDDIEVSNFVLPLYFTGGEEMCGRNDFLCNVNDGSTLTSFGVNPGGYVGFYDPALDDHDTFSMAGDEEAERRLKIKGRAEAARRGGRHQKVGAGVSARIARKLGKARAKKEAASKGKAKARHKAASKR